MPGECIGRMRHFYGSANGRFFVVLLEHEMTVYRADIKLWSREIDLSDYTVLRLGNKGQLFILASPGLYIWPHDPAEPPTLLEHFSRLALAQSGCSLGRIVVGKEGTALCAELVSDKAERNLAQKLLPSSREPDRTHELLFFDTISGRQQVFQRLSIPSWLSDTRFWDISNDFRWITFATEGKARHSLRIVVQDLQDEYPRQEFAFNEPGFRSITINRDGTVCLDTFHQGEGRLHLISRGNIRSAVTPPSAYELRHFARTYIALGLTPIPHVLFKNLRDGLIAHIDMASLSRLGLEWSLHFDERDEINLLTMRDGILRLTHTQPDRIETDSRRWDFLANSQNLLEVEADTLRTVYHDGMPVEDPQRDAERRRKQQELSSHLASSVNQLKQSRTVDAAQSIAQLRRKLEAVRMDFATGMLTSEAFTRQQAELEKQIQELTDEAAKP